MDTKTRILNQSLALFNVEGEDQQAAIDIANALEISPGNLYYHFKGKDAIIHALFDAFEEEMRIILAGAKGGVSSLEDYWVYIHILLEEIWDFRFFYKNLGALLARYPDLARRFRRLTADLRTAIGHVFAGLSENDVIELDPKLADAAVEQTIRTLTFWLPMSAVDAVDEETDNAVLERTIFQTVAVIAPYLRDRDTMVGEMLDRLDALIDA